MPRLPLFALMLVATASLGQVYKTVDEDGNVRYSDTPAAGGSSEAVEIPQTNTVSPPPANAWEQREQPREQAQEAVDYQPVITAPANETTIPMGPGNFSVSAEVQPPLADGHTLQLYIDGSPEGVPQERTSWSLTNVFRGAHDLEVAVLDRDGEELARSRSVRVYVMRPSINFKHRN
jgi:hypothetical protein